MELFDRKLLDVLRSQLNQSGETISVAESVTTGLIQLALGSAMEATSFYQGGITAYNLGHKYKLLGIEPIHAQSMNCVSERVAREMAQGVCKLFRSDWGLGITGYASPVPESGNRCYAYYCIARGETDCHAGKLESPANDPFEVQLYFAKTVVKIATDYIRTA